MIIIITIKLLEVEKEDGITALDKTNLKMWD